MEDDGAWRKVLADIHRRGDRVRFRGTLAVPDHRKRVGPLGVLRDVPLPVRDLSRRGLDRRPTKRRDGTTRSVTPVGRRQTARRWPTARRTPLRAGRRGRARRLFPGAGGRAGLARADRRGRGRGSLGARDRPRRRPGARRFAAGRDRALARPPPRPRAHRRRARRERRAGAPRDRRARDPADARAHRQGARERRDATRSAPRRLEPRAPGRDRPADDRARRGGGRRRPCLRRAARRPGRARPPPARANRARRLWRDRDTRDRAGDGRSPGDRPLHVGGRDRFARRVAGRRPPPRVARRRPARLGLAAGRGHVLRPLLERGRADTGDAAAAVARSRPRGRPPSIGRSLVRMVGLVLAIVPLFAGFIPVLFTARRRGLPDFLAGTVVVYDDASPKP